MEKFTPYEKLSKKKQREMNAARRTAWGPLNPTTRKPENSRAYNRRKAQKWKDDSSSVLFLFYSFGSVHLPKTSDVTSGA